MQARFCDETAYGFGWIAAEPAFLQRASHALRAGGLVWLVDPVDAEGVVERVRALGEPAGVIQLLDRHERDGRRLAERLGVPFHRLPERRMVGTPFRTIPLLARRRWREVALWWEEEGVLVCADALGTPPYYLAAGERLAVHPLLRLAPPRSLRDLSRCLAPGHVLCGHGEGIHGAAAAFALREALATARRRAPRYLWHQVTRRRR